MKDSKILVNEPILYLVIPCYNEDTVLPITNGIFINKLNSLIDEKKISKKSKILFVNDGSNDTTWDIIQCLSEQNSIIQGISLSRNFGHQYALIAGLMDVKDVCDIVVSIDCDGQDDINAIDEMIEKYEQGFDIVYGVRNKRIKDSFFKRITAEGFYKLMQLLGANIVFNHADYRLLSSRILRTLSKFEETNLFLRGIIPLLGYKSTTVFYERDKRCAGDTHYPLGKMLALAIDGITSLTSYPLRLIAIFGIIVALFSFIGVIWSFYNQIIGNTVQGWASMTCIVCFVSGVQLICMGILGEYISKIYIESKHRPRYIISEKTYEQDN